VGLPGESVQIAKGDVLIDGRIARKSLPELRAMRILVHDSRFIPKDSDRFPRWVFLKGSPHRRLSTGWSQAGGEFVHQEAAAPNDPEDWLVYRHWDPVLNRYAPVHDHYAYNGGDLGSENTVTDLSIEAQLSISQEVRTIAVMLRSGSDRFVVRVPVGEGGELQVARNGRRCLIVPRANPLGRIRRWPCQVRLEAAVVDRRLAVALDGEPLFEPLDYEDPAGGPPPDESPMALGVQGGAMTVSDLKLFRDVYYTSSLGSMPRHPHGVNDPYRLGDDEYFVLGDNSPVSNDSRFWAGSPVVPGSMFLGKPFLVHLPGQAVALEVFGRSVYWVPDPRKIRYIH
jgi:signal peptidase I